VLALHGALAAVAGAPTFVGTGFISSAVDRKLIADGTLSSQSHTLALFGRWRTARPRHGGWRADGRPPRTDGRMSGPGLPARAGPGRAGPKVQRPSPVSLQDAEDDRELAGLAAPPDLALVGQRAGRASRWFPVLDVTKVLPVPSPGSASVDTRVPLQRGRSSPR
jgi:hypothetical protein